MDRQFWLRGVLALVIVAIVVIGYRYRADFPQNIVSLTSNPTEEISVIILPHHDIVRTDRQEFLQSVGKKIAQPKTIVLLSPNHYENGRGSIQTTDRVWEISAGTIEPNLAVIDSLQSLASSEPESFTNEHGIKAVLADVWATFPQAKIVPLLFKSTTSLDQLAALNDRLLGSCADCLVVASVDFSHYQPAILADLHDRLTARSLALLDPAKILKDAEVDSPPSLAMSILWAKSRQTNRFVLAKQTNSSRLVGDPDSEGTSHFFATFERGEALTVEPAASFIIGGDMMFGRMIAHTFLAGGLEKSLEKLGNRVFWGTDLAAINLEGPVSKTPVPDDIRPNHLVFNFPPETIKALRYLRVNAASLANNHSANAGRTGLADTRELLTAAGIQPVGGPNDNDTVTVASITGHGLTIHLIGAHLLASTPDLTALIQKYSSASTDRVIIFPHWGAEYAAKHAPSQERLAHSWIDAGADAVIGAHPHVIQDAEVYRQRPIFYSLGNLLFDQTFSTETQQGLLVAGEFSANSLTVFALPIESVKYQPRLLRGEAKETILRTLYQPLASYLHTTESGATVVIPEGGE